VSPTGRIIKWIANGGAEIERKQEAGHTNQNKNKPFHQ
jgi:hypothetical protein